MSFLDFIEPFSPNCPACARHAPYMLRHAAAAIPPISQPMHCASVTGRAHALAIRVAFGSVAGDCSRRDLPSGLLLAPLRACQVHRFPPGGPSRFTCAAPLLPFCVGCVVATQLRTGECGAAVGGARGAQTRTPQCVPVCPQNWCERPFTRGHCSTRSYPPNQPLGGGWV